MYVTQGSHGDHVKRDALLILLVLNTVTSLKVGERSLRPTSF